jgi:hypothetical protein
MAQERFRKNIGRVADHMRSQNVVAVVRSPDLTQTLMFHRLSSTGELVAILTGAAPPPAQTLHSPCLVLCIRSPPTCSVRRAAHGRFGSARRVASRGAVSRALCHRTLCQKRAPVLGTLPTRGAPGVRLHVPRSLRLRDRARAPWLAGSGALVAAETPQSKMVLKLSLDLSNSSACRESVRGDSAVG